MTRLRARMRTESAGFSTGWTMSQLSTLVRILDFGPVSISELAAAEHVRPQSMAETVAALKRGELVTAEQDPDDRRKSLIAVTAAGQDLVTSVRASRRAWLAQAIESELSAEEIKAVHEATQLLHRLANTQTDGGLK